MVLDAVLALLGRLPATAVISDIATGEVLWVNDRDLHLVGAESPESLVGKNLLQFLDPAQHGVALRDIEAIGRGESPPPLTYRIKRVDGGFAYMRIASVPMRWGDGTAMLSLLTDLTELEVAMRELAESEERYRVLVETSPAGIAVIAQGSEILYVNPALADALGIVVSKMVGRSIYDFIESDSVKPVRDMRRALIQGGEAAPTLTIVLKRPDGRLVDTTIQSTRISWQGDDATQTVLRDLVVRDA